MGVDVAAYVERKKSDGSWELVTEKPISARLKYIVEDYHEFPRMDWDDLSPEMREKYKKDDNGQVYASFYSTTVEKLEHDLSAKITRTYTKINTIVKALGAYRMYSDDGEEIDCWDANEKERLTYPVNKDLIEELQFSMETLRDIGRRETFDMFVNEHVEWDKEYRIVFVAT